MILAARQQRARGVPGSPAAEITFPSRDSLLLRRPELFCRPEESCCRDFLNRVFSLPTVRSVEIDPVRGSARIVFAGPAAPPVWLEHLAAALSQSAGVHEQVTARLCLAPPANGPIRVTRHNAAISTWHLVHELPGRIRLRHPEVVARPALASRIPRQLALVPGVTGAKANHRTGTVLVLFDHRRLTAAHLLHVMEGMLCDPRHPVGAGYEHVPAETGLCHANLGLATVADFVAPAIGPVSAGLLIATNLKAVRDAGRELARLRPGVATLYTAITGCTLASGYFFSAALMAWMMNFWDRRYHRRLAEAQRSLLQDFRGLPRFAWKWGDHVELETPVEQLRSGDTIVVRPGEILPVDGVIAEGTAEIDESPVMRGELTVERRRGDRVVAGSRLLRGVLRISVETSGEQTLAAQMGALVETATTPEPKPLKVRGAPVANHTVPATLATAGAGLLTGDVATALAILRADYATGPGMVEPLGALESVHRALREGVLACSSDLFARLRQVNLLIVDELHGPAYRDRNPTPADPVIGLDQAPALMNRLRRANRRLQVLFRGDPAHARLTNVPGVRHFPQEAADDAGLAEFIRNQTRLGRRVAFLGNCQENPLAAAAAHVTIVPGLPVAGTPHHPDAYLLEPEVGRALDLWEYSQREPRRRWVNYSVTAAHNLCCVAGAFLLGFTGLHAVLLTNLGTLTVYELGKRRLRRVTSQRPSRTTGLPESEPFLDPAGEHTHAPAGNDRRIGWSEQHGN